MQVSAITTPLLRGYVAWLTEQKYEPSTISRRLASLRSFFKFCQREEIVDQNPAAPLGEPGVFYTTGALGTVIGTHAGDMIISIALFFFAFTTIMAYYYYAETNLVYLFNRWRRRQYRKHPEQLDELERADQVFGDDRGEKVVVWVLRCGTITAVFLGSMAGSGVAWTLGDIGVGAMAWINIVAILLLSPKALRSLRDYERQCKQGLEPRFKPRDLNIRQADFWDEESQM